MKKWLIAFYLLITLFILFFILKTKKNNETLGDKYYYLPSYEAIDIGFPEGAIIYKSYQKNVFSDIKIHGEVISMNYNKEFIIALQQKKANDLPLMDKMLYYFIILKKKDIVYGPFNKREYLQKRKELLVPRELILEE